MARSLTWMCTSSGSSATSSARNTRMAKVEAIPLYLCRCLCKANTLKLNANPAASENCNLPGARTSFRRSKHSPPMSLWMSRKNMFMFHSEHNSLAFVFPHKRNV